MKVLICGSRNVAVLGVVSRAIRESGFVVTEIISGGARGADALAERYAALSGIPVQIFKPDWDKHGKKAGILRNLEMVKNADAVIAIWDGESRGTKSTIEFAKRENKPIYVLITKN